MRARSGVVSVLLMLALAACGNPFSNEPEPTARDLLAAYAAEADAPAIAVPKVLPDGYGMLWANQYFAENAELSGVDVCVVASKKKILGRCVGTEDASPWVSFKLDGNIVVVSTLSPPEDPDHLQAWADAEWTTDWRSVEWIDTTFTDG